MVGNMTRPRPCRRTMFGGPSKAQNINTMRPVLPKVGDGLSPRSGVVEVGDPVWAEHREGAAHALGGDVDVPRTVQGCGAHEEHRLVEDGVEEHRNGNRC